MAQRKTVQLDDRVIIFIQIIAELCKYADCGLKDIADEAGVHWGTLYAWKAGRTRAPRIDTITKVANVLGFDVVLQKQRKKPILRVVK